MQAAIVTRRSKVIFCRVSEQEFKDLEARRVGLGLPSVSECLRISLQRLLASPTGNADDLLQGLTKKLDVALELLRESSARQRAHGIHRSQAEESFHDTSAEESFLDTNEQKA